MKGIRILCPDCKGISNALYTNVTSFHAEKNYDIFRCGECNLCFTHPFKINKSFYSEDKYGYEWKRRLQDPEKRFRNKYYVKLIRKFAKRDILEIGCMFGLLLEELKGEFHVEGIELAKDPCLETRSKGIRCFNGTVEEYVKKNSPRFDTVISFHTIEHTDNVKSFLQSIKKILSPDGTLILAMPNFEESRKMKSKWGWNVVPAHQYHFTKRTINSVLEKNGFKVADVIYRGGDSGFYISSIYNILPFKPNVNGNEFVSKIVFFLLYNLILKHAFERGKEEMIVIAKV